MPSVLVVDDDRAIAAVLVLFFAEEGYAVRMAHDGAAALAIMAREPVDVVVSDIHMPIMDGLALLNETRAQGLGIPVVLVSAGFPDRRGAVPNGVPFVAKPFDAAVLLTVVARALRPPSGP